MAQEEPDEASDAPAAAEDEPEQEQGSRWNWWLIVIPILAVLDLFIVFLYGANVLSPSDIAETVELVHIAIAGAGVLVILLIVEAVLLVGGHPENLEDEEEPAPGPETPAAREDVPEAASPNAETPDLEALATDDEVEGRTVLEMARPPKGHVETGVYSTTYVEVDAQSVLRVEELVARKAA